MQRPTSNVEGPEPWNDLEVASWTLGIGCFPGLNRLAHRIIVALLLAVGLFPTTAQAHKPRDSYLSLKVEGARMSGQWDIAIRDLDFALGLDGNQDGDVTWGELKSRQQEIATYVLERLRIEVNGRPAPVQVTEHQVQSHLDGPYAVLRFLIENTQTPRSIDVDYRTFFELDPQHRGLMRLEHGEETQTAIFSADETRHTFELSVPDRWAEGIAFVREGIWHIWIGFDHILFLVALLLPAVLRREEGGWQAVEGFRKAFFNVIRIVTAFTIAHSITLGLATFEIVRLPSRWVETVIAASVVLAALHNFYPLLQGKSWVAAFVFGLIHGFGFAGVLGELGLTEGTLLLALVGFNVGVEAGQLAIVCVFLPLAYVFRGSWFYRRVALRLGSALIAMLAAIWMIERCFEVKLLRF